MAYTRDPNAVFSSSSPLPPPLNFINSHHTTGKQPVRYQNVTLLQPMGSLQKGATLAFVEVHWLLGQVPSPAPLLPSQRLDFDAGEPL